MDTLLEQLGADGADIAGAMGRFLDDVELYKTCFTVFLADDAFSGLGQALSARDYQRAFEFAHTLKGVAGNMGLTPIYQPICTLVEALRGGDHADLPRYYDAISAQLDRLKKLQAAMTA